MMVIYTTINYHAWYLFWLNNAVRNKKNVTIFVMLDPTNNFDSSQRHKKHKRFVREIECVHI